MTTLTLPPLATGPLPDDAPRLVAAAHAFADAADALREALGAHEGTALLALPLDTIGPEAAAAAAKYADALVNARAELRAHLAAAPTEKHAEVLGVLPRMHVPPVVMTYTVPDALLALLRAHGVHATRSALAPDVLDVFPGEVDAPSSDLPVVRAAYDPLADGWTVAAAAFESETPCTSLYAALSAVLVLVGAVTA